MKNTKSIGIFVIIGVLIVGGLFLTNTKKQSISPDPATPTEMTVLDTDLSGNSIVRDNPEFFSWANTMLGKFGTNDVRMRSIVRELKTKDFLWPDSYLESQTKKDIIALLDELIVLLAQQQTEVTELSTRLETMKADGTDLNHLQTSYLQKVAAVLNMDTLEPDFVSAYRALARGLEKAKMHYEFMDEVDATSMDDLEGDVWFTQDNLVNEIEEDFLGGSSEILLPPFPLVYTSWTSLEKDNRIVVLDELSDDDRARLGLEATDIIIDTSSLVSSLVSSAQQCLDQVPEKVLEKSFIQILGIQKGAEQKAYVALISDGVVNGFEVTPELLASGIIHPWHTTDGFQSTMVSIPGLTCSPVEPS